MSLQLAAAAHSQAHALRLACRRTEDVELPSIMCSSVGRNTPRPCASRALPRPGAPGTRRDPEVSCKVGARRAERRIMTAWKHRLALSCAAGWLALPAGDAHAEPACRGEAAVDVTIELDPRDDLLEEQIQRRLAAELRARGIEVCPLAAASNLAHVRVQAAAPALTPALVKIHSGAGPSLERHLDFAALPREARSSALASSADELLATLLQTAAVSPSGNSSSPSDIPVGELDTASASAVTQGDDQVRLASAAGREGARALPQVELGVGAGAARFEGGARAYTVELLARWRPLFRLSAVARAGGARGRSEGALSSSWHVGLDAGVELLQPAAAWGLAARAGAVLARVQRMQELEVLTPVGRGLQRQALGSSWEVAVNAGAEGSFRAGPLAVALGVAVLVPLSTTSAPELPNSFDVTSSVSKTGFGETLGGELILRLWLALDGAG